jgi:hypothetical protein
MANVYMAPEATPASGKRSIFLAGSIDMGKAVDWQTKVSEALKTYDIDIYNPRRPDWDSTWKQDITNDKFREQVVWELDHQEKADIVCFCFDPKGQAPITLLELGLFHNKKAVVCCPEGFWRKGNVDVVCAYYKIPLVEDMELMIAYLKVLLHDKHV